MGKNVSVLVGIPDTEKRDDKEISILLVDLSPCHKYVTYFD